MAEILDMPSDDVNALIQSRRRFKFGKEEEALAGQIFVY